ncbi:MAG TPA: ACT domain-containing protein [Candidatus Baltobacteraceae bacterium]|nr:ACT domain-containing protein [Candidatus Baltobacteraceae bacterium]
MQRITVVVQNRPGLLAEITELLASKDLSISSIVAESVGSQGVLRIACGYHAVTEDVLLARVEDKPGALAQLSRDQR